jgi:hypothetical protein
VDGLLGRRTLRVMPVLAMSELISSWVISLSGFSQEKRVRDRIPGIGVIDFNANDFYSNIPSILADLAVQRLVSIQKYPFWFLQSSSSFLLEFTNPVPTVI